MATPQNDSAGVQNLQKGDPLSGAKGVLAGADAFEKSADPTGAQKPKPTAKPIVSGAKPVTHTGGLGAELGAKAANIHEAANAGVFKDLPKMHTGGVIPKDGPYMMQKGEKVIPASGRQSEYRTAFEERGRQGLHKYGQSAKEQTRQVGGNTPAKGEEQLKGAEKVANPTKE